MKIHSALSAFTIFILAACSPQAEQSGNPQAPEKVNSSSAPPEGEYLTAEQMDALRRSRTVAVVFTPAAGSSGNGEVMKELKSINRPLLSPNENYDVFEPQSNLTNKELKQQIEMSLDRDRQVLIDNGGTPESRKKADELIMEIVGGFIPDTAGTIIQRAPQDKGGGYYTIPLYSNADVQKQIAKGLIPNAEAQSNSIENFFFGPQQNPK